MRKRARTDNNHAEIVEALRAKGWEVLSLAPLGGGAPDILIGRSLGIEHSDDGTKHTEYWDFKLVEIKDGAKSPSRQKLTDAEIEFHKRWPVIVLRSIEDALAL